MRTSCAKLASTAFLAFLCAVFWAHADGPAADDFGSFSSWSSVSEPPDALKIQVSMDAEQKREVAEIALKRQAVWAVLQKAVDLSGWKQKRPEQLTIWFKGDGNQPDYKLSLQEKDGEEWICPIPGASTQWQKITLPLSGFEPAKHGPKNNSVLDLDKVGKIKLITGGLPKTFWVSGISVEGSQGKSEASVSGVFEPVDLSKAANKGLMDEKAGDKAGGWTDEGDMNDFRRLRSGEQRFCEVPFSIIDPNGNNGKAAIVLAGQERPYFPEKVSIPLDRKAKIVYFLHTASWAYKREGIAKYVAVYKDGSKAEIPITAGEEIANATLPPDALPKAKLAWRGRNAYSRIGVYLCAWINPRPDEEISSIEFISEKKGIPILLALTLAKPGEESEKLAKDWEAFCKRELPKAELSVDFSKEVRKISRNCYGLFSSHNSKRFMESAYLEDSPGCQRFIENLKPTIVRVFISYDPVKPSPEKGKWKWDTFDRHIEAILKIGGQPMISIDQPPAWMGENKRPSWPWSLVPKSHQDYAQWCADFVRHVNVEKGYGVVYWEVDNEPDLKNWDGADYRKAFRLAAAKMREADPKIKIGGPVAATERPMEDFVKECGDMADFLSWHVYGGETGEIGKAIAKIDLWTKRYWPEKKFELAVTELNSSATWNAEPQIYHAYNASWYAQTLSRAVKSGLDIAVYFCDFGNLGLGQEILVDWRPGHYKIPYYYYSGFQTYPSYYAFWSFTHLMGDTLVDCQKGDAVAEVFATKKGDECAVMVVNKRNEKVHVDLKMEGLKEGDAKIRQYVLDESSHWDLRAAPDGNAKPLPFTERDADLKPVSHLPLELYPYGIATIVFKAPEGRWPWPFRLFL